MYAAPPPPPTTTTPVVDGAPRRGGLAAAPVLAICCLLFLLFLIASTIVLSLIPVYLPTRGTVGAGLSRTYYTRLTPNTTLGNDGTLDDNSRNTIARAISTKLGFQPQASVLSPITLATSAKRKRRGLILARSRRQGGTQRGYCTNRFQRRFCGLCVPRFLRFIIIVILFIEGQFIVVEIIVEFFLFAITIPPLQGPSTASIASTASTASAGGGTTSAGAGGGTTSAGSGGGTTSAGSGTTTGGAGATTSSSGTTASTSPTTTASTSTVTGVLSG